MIIESDFIFYVHIYLAIVLLLRLFIIYKICDELFNEMIRGNSIIKK